MKYLFHMPLFHSSIHFSAPYCGNNLNMAYLKLYICWAGGKDGSRGEIQFYNMLTCFKGSHFWLFTTANCLIMDLLKLNFAENDTVNMMDYYYFFFLSSSLAWLMWDPWAFQIWFMEINQRIQEQYMTEIDLCFQAAKLFQISCNIYLWVKGMNVENQTPMFQKWMNWG